METGIQQVGIAGAVAFMSFEDEALKRSIMCIVIFGSFNTFWGAVWSVILRYACAPPLARADVDDKPSEKGEVFSKHWRLTGENLAQARTRPS